MRLIDADALKYKNLAEVNGRLTYVLTAEEIDNAPTVEIPENAVNCILTMFGKCSYNKTGCSDCEIKDKIRKALEERPRGEWKLHGMIYYCSECGHECGESGDNFCGNCGADMISEKNETL